ncbi:hypothetical protein ACLK17_02560 [Escherichia coli]
MGQALYAAKSRNVPEERRYIRLHSYFFALAIVRSRLFMMSKRCVTVRSFSARRVAAIQNGKPIFYTTALSRHEKRVSNIKQQCRPRQRLMACLRKRKSPNRRRTGCRQRLKIIHLRLSAGSPSGGVHNPLKGHVAEPHRQAWICANGSVPDDLRVHQYLLGYASDLHFLPVA